MWSACTNSVQRSSACKVASKGKTRSTRIRSSSLCPGRRRANAKGEDPLGVGWRIAGGASREPWLGHCWRKETTLAPVWARAWTALVRLDSPQVVRLFVLSAQEVTLHCPAIVTQQDPRAWIFDLGPICSSSGGRTSSGIGAEGTCVCGWITALPVTHAHRVRRRMPRSTECPGGQVSEDRGR